LKLLLHVALLLVMALTAVANISRTTLEMTPGSHQLIGYAIHPSGLFTTNKSINFTVTVADRATDSYDAMGQLTQRIFRKANGTTNRIQTFAWDAKGRLHKVTEREPATTNGFDWKPAYDGLDRRLFTTTVVVTNGVTNSAFPKIIAQYFDPLFGNLELGVTENGRTTWKLYGPDTDGRYGGMNGLGGFDAIVPGPELFCPLIADARGNLHAVYDQTHGSLTWYASRQSGYGGVPGYRPLPLGHGAMVDAASAWRGKWSDVTGLHWFGARYYDLVAARFISYDPAWNLGDAGGYSAFAGNPHGYWDPNGLVASGFMEGRQVNNSSPANSSWAFDVGYALGGINASYYEGLGGGASITANTLSFGGSDAIGITQSGQYQGWEYTWSRGLSTVGREAAIAAVTLGTFQAARLGSEGALYGYQGLQVANAGRSGYAIGTGIDQVSQGNNWGYLNIAGGTLGLAGGFTMTAIAPELNAGVQTMRQGVAQNFYQAAGFSQADAASHFQGMDFSQSVRITSLQPGTSVVQYQFPGRSVGNYFAPAGTPANTLGINPAGRVGNLYDVNQPVRVLQSTTADTTGLSALPPHVRGAGGGIQYFTPQSGAFTPR